MGASSPRSSASRLGSADIYTTNYQASPSNWALFEARLGGTAYWGHASLRRSRWLRYLSAGPPGGARLHHRPDRREGGHSRCVRSTTEQGIKINLAPGIR